MDGGEGSVDSGAGEGKKPVKSELDSRLQVSLSMAGGPCSGQSTAVPMSTFPQATPLGNSISLSDVEYTH